VRRDLQADEAVSAERLLVDGPEGVGRQPDVFDGEGFVDLEGGPPLRNQPADRLGMVRVAPDGLLEDRGIAGLAADAVLFDQPLEVTGEDVPATDAVEPERLTEPLHLQERIG